MEPEKKTPRERAEDLVRLLVPDWRPTARQGLWAIRIFIVLGVLIAIGYQYDITLWDWIKLLIVPAGIAIGVAWLNRAQERERQAQQGHREREREAEAEQREREREAAEGARRDREREAQAAQTERALEVENQRAQDEALQAYLDQMSHLLTDQGLRSKTDWLDEARVAARARSLAVLRRLVGERKKSVLQFLYEAQLINRSKNGPLIGLSGADLTSTDLRYITLRNAALNGARLENADLSEAKLNDIDLGGADLSGADMSNAKLRSANLVNADLQRKAERELNGANLSGADVSEANLSGADLRDANLRDAYLAGATGMTNEELGRQASSLEGATMPNGQKYADWLKSKDQEENKKSNGSS